MPAKRPIGDPLGGVADELSGTGILYQAETRR